MLGKGAANMAESPRGKIFECETPIGTAEKPRYKIWGWQVARMDTPMSQNPTGARRYFYVLEGISNQRETGRHVRTSRLLRVDFEAKTAETLNSIYELQDGYFMAGAPQ